MRYVSLHVRVDYVQLHRRLERPMSGLPLEPRPFNVDFFLMTTAVVPKVFRAAGPMLNSEGRGDYT